MAGTVQEMATESHFFSDHIELLNNLYIWIKQVTIETEDSGGQ